MQSGLTKQALLQNIIPVRPMYKPRSI